MGNIGWTTSFLEYLLSRYKLSFCLITIYYYWKKKILTIKNMYLKNSLVFTVHDEPARGSWKCNLLGYFRRYFRINDPVLTSEVNLYHGVYQKFPQEQSYNHNYLLPYFISSLNDGVPKMILKNCICSGWSSRSGQAWNRSGSDPSTTKRCNSLYCTYLPIHKS